MLSLLTPDGSVIKNRFKMLAQIFSKRKYF